VTWSLKGKFLLEKKKNSSLFCTFPWISIFILDFLIFLNAINCESIFRFNDVDFSDLIFAAKNDNFYFYDLIDITWWGVKFDLNSQVQGFFEELTSRCVAGKFQKRRFGWNLSPKCNLRNYYSLDVKDVSIQLVRHFCYVTDNLHHYYHMNFRDKLMKSNAKNRKYQFLINRNYWLIFRRRNNIYELVLNLTIMEI
jgi:hypothetical protein